MSSLRPLILFGDSVLFGIGATHRNFGCGRILKTLSPGMPILIKAKNKDTTYDGLKRLYADVLKNTTDANVIILFGNNDCRLKGPDEPAVSLLEYRENLIKIIDKIKESGKIPIIANLQPIDSEKCFRVLPEIKKFSVNICLPREWQKKYSDICEDVARYSNIRLADIRLVLEKSDKNILADDGLHPNDLGHKLIAQQFLEVLKRDN